jgi:hypothetical protein
LKLLDFGIAKLTEAVRNPLGTRLTSRMASKRGLDEHVSSG